MNFHQIATRAGKTPALDVVSARSRRSRATTAAILREPGRRLSQLALMSAALLALMMPAHAARAQTSNYVIQGPTLTIGSCPGLCASIAYPAGSPIQQSRIVEVPRGNLQFNVPVVSTVGSLSDLHLEYEVTVKAVGPNGETASNTAITTLTGAGSATLAVPLNVDWNESVVTFEIYLSKSYLTVACNGKLGCKPFNYDYTETTTGPNLSSVPLGLHYSQALPADAFLVVQTPAAAFQLPVLPVAILYSSLGNASNAVSVLGFTETSGTNQTFSTTSGQTIGYTQDDKTTYQAGVTLSFNNDLSSVGGPNLGTVSAGFNFSGSWDTSVEQDTSSQSTSATSVTYQQVKSFQPSNPAAKNQPPLNEITPSTEPFWNDEILVLANAQYAVWDYPASPALQPLGNAGTIEMSIRSLDNCYTTPSAVKPNSLSPSNWTANTALSVGTFVVALDSNDDPIGEQVVTSAGTTGSSAPNWASINGATTADGTVVWTNETAHLYQKPDPSKVVYLWLDSPGCGAIANVDAFYAQKSQAAYPGDYVSIASIDVQTQKPNQWTNQQDSTTTKTQTNSVQLTSKTTSVGSNSDGVTASLSNLLSSLGLNLSLGSTSTATTVFTGQNSATLQQQVFYTDVAAQSTTICDSFAENLAVNVVQDLIFDGIAVQVPSMTFPQTPSAAVAHPFEEPNLDETHASQGVSSRDGKISPKPLPAVEPSELARAHSEAASRHVEREVPQAAPGSVIPGSTK